MRISNNMIIENFSIEYGKDSPTWVNKYIIENLIINTTPEYKKGKFSNIKKIVDVFNNSQYKIVRYSADFYSLELGLSFILIFDVCKMNTSTEYYGADKILYIKETKVEQSKIKFVKFLNEQTEDGFKLIKWFSISDNSNPLIKIFSKFYKDKFRIAEKYTMDIIYSKPIEIKKKMDTTFGLHSFFNVLKDNKRIISIIKSNSIYAKIEENNISKCVKLTALDDISLEEGTILTNDQIKKLSIYIY